LILISTTPVVGSESVPTQRVVRATPDTRRHPSNSDRRPQQEPRSSTRAARHRRFRTLVVGGTFGCLLLCAACGSSSDNESSSTASSYAQQPASGYNPSSSPAPATDTATSAPSGSPTPDPSIVGPAANPSSSPVLAAVVHAWSTMTSTKYAHHDVVDAGAGTYQFDCVGMTNYFLSVSAPAANAALRSALGIGAHYVPRPAAMASYFAALPSAGNGRWTPVRQITDIRAGDIIAVPPRPGTAETGHALIAGGPPRQLSNGDVALLVWDSTATPHGPSDTRLTDPRNRPIAASADHPGPRPSGLGRGTVMVAPTATGAPGQLFWSVDGPSYGTQVEIARPTV